MCRDLFLIFKEAVNNAARHSDCAKVVIDFQVKGAWFVLKVSDDGRGINSATANDGQGLLSMHRRAKNLGGELSLQSEPGHGTEVILKVPRRPH